MKIFEKIVDFVNVKLMGGLSQLDGHHNPVKVITPGMPETLRKVAAEGAVLLENQVLPFAEGTKVSVFGRVQTSHFFTGYGSGGDVNMPYQINLLEGLRGCESLVLNEELAAVYEDFHEKNPIDHGMWGNWPRCYAEMPLTKELVEKAKQLSDKAVIIIGRSSGEDRENALEAGSFYLNEEEKQMLRLVTEQFPDAVLLLNIGSVMDFSFLEEYSFGAVMILWQGGMESGNAAADLLCGKAIPSGRLTDTIAKKYEDYPSAEYFGGKDRNEYWEDIYVGYRYFETFAKDKVLYPFGYGLSYTSFEKKAVSAEDLKWQVTVTNTGNRAGKETVLLYVQKPCKVLGNPSRELVAFAKTKELLPGESQTLELEIDRSQLASFDEAGLTGNRNAYVIEAGTYSFYLGGDVRMAQKISETVVENTEATEWLQEATAPEAAFPILAAQEVYGETVVVSRTAAPRTIDVRQRILDNLPEGVPQTGDKGYKLKDVKDGKITLDTFVAQLSLEELEAISRGGYIMDHPWGAKGNAGIFGGVCDSLRDKGIPAVITTDGPSGIRLYDSCSLMPIGTLLACTFDKGLIEGLFHQVGEEMKERGSDVLLAPGMNIHRNPLCGRNFEYFSEDPYVTGHIAAAVVKGVQSVGLSACPKHFACNNQEFRRSTNDSVVSQRALREIYLKGFEICVKEAAPKNIMTSYNKINGVWGHYHYDLVTTILRGEWKYAGNVITDWWMQPSASPEFPNMKDNAYRVRAQVDVLMPGGRRQDIKKKPDGTLLATYGKKDGITLGEMQLCAKNVLRCVMDLKEL